MSKKNYFDNAFVEEKITEFQQTGNKAIIEELTPIFRKLISGVIGRYKLLRKTIEIMPYS